MDELEGWTLGQLVERAARALADADVRAPNGRVTELPDGRVIRWYATIGLVDRPSAMRGRTALYGPRHLLQLVAVKRLQAQGRPLADIQATLTGATDAVLSRIADLPAQPESPRPALSGNAAPGDASSSIRASSIRASGDALSGMAASGGSPGTDGPVASGQRRFWTQAPTVEQGSVLSGVRLAGGLVLLLPATPDADDLAKIESAAGPLLDLLAARGLLTTDRLTTDRLTTDRAAPTPVTTDLAPNSRDADHGKGTPR